ITVLRLGGSQGLLTVTNAISNGTAVNGVNFTGFTNVLTWNNGETTPKTFLVPVQADGVITTNLSANLRLFGAIAYASSAGTNVNGLALGAFTNATLVITNTDALGTLRFSSATYSENENGGFAIIPVIRT